MTKEQREEIVAELMSGYRNDMEQLTDDELYHLWQETRRALKILSDGGDLLIRTVR